MENLPNTFPGNSNHIPAPLPPQPRPQVGKKNAAGANAAIPPAPAPGQQRLLRFTCPACFVFLELDPGAPYAGQPAPCPMCQTMILPPIIFHVAAQAAAVPAQPSRFKPKLENMTIEFKRRRRHS